MNEHDRLVSEGFLEGSLSRKAMRRWPQWASAHAKVCPECQRVVLVERLLMTAADAAGPPPRERPLPPAPTIEELLARPRRQAPAFSAHELARDLTPFPPETYRNATAASLTVTRTPVGVHISDPDAHDLAVIVLRADGRAQTIHRVCDEPEGVVVHLPLVVDEPLRLIVLGACGGLEAEHWRLWLQERARTGEEPLIDGTSTQQLHVAELQLQPAARPSLLRMARGAVAPSTPPVQALLTPAQNAGNAGHVEEASRYYLRARALAEQIGDVGGTLRATIGVGATLVDCGFEEDAERVYGEVVERFELDEPMAAFVSRGLAWRGLAIGDVTSASAWADELSQHCPADDPLLARLRMALAMERGHPSDALELDALATPGRTTTDFVSVGAVRGAICHHQLGRTREAQAQLNAVTPGATWSSDARLWYLCALAILSPDANGHSRYAALVDSARHDVAGCVPTHWERAPLRLLVRVLHDAGDVHGARHAAETLCGGGPTAGSRRIGLDCASAETLVLEAEGNVRLSEVRRTSWQHLVRDLRTAILRNTGIDRAAEVLGALLFNGQRPEGVPLSVSSHGTLAGLPWAGLFTAAGVVMPPITEIIHSSHVHEPLSRRVVSLADSDGTLPGAAREVTADEGDLVLRGARATFATLGELAEVGLLHLGLHAERVNGVPTLYFADRPVTALEIAGLHLSTRPTVFLSGCRTAGSETPSGVEYSLAHAFLRAGASAVVATQWPVRDEEGLAIFRPLIAGWGNCAPEVAAAGIARQLRAGGQPARCWAAAVVYR